MTAISILPAVTVGVTIFLCTSGLAVVANAEAAKPKGTPIALTISNKGCFKGKGTYPYIRKAIAKRRLAARKGNGDELATFYVAVPSRSWRGLTVTGVGLHYERTSVYFGEPVAQVREVLRAIGVSITDNGSIPINNEEAVEVQALRTTVGEARRFGASEVE